MNLRRTLPGLPRGALPTVFALACGEANQVFLALRQVGVYEVDAVTLRARPVAPPFRGAFARVRQIWADGGELYVVSASPAPADGDPDYTSSDADFTLRSNTLWRRLAGRWKRLIAGSDQNHNAEIQSARSFLKTPEGVWLGSNGEGLWLVGRDDRAHLVSWQRGFNIRERQNLLALQNTAFLVTNFDGTTRVPGFAPLAAQTGAPGDSTFQTYPDLVQDAKLHLWGVLNLRDHVA